MGCSGMQKEEDKRDEKETNQKRMGVGPVMGRNQGKDEEADLGTEVERGSEEGKV